MGNEAMDKRALDEFLNDLAAGRAANAPGGLDRSFVETMGQLQSLARAPLPESSKKRVDQQVESAIGILARDVRKDAPKSQSVLSNIFPGSVASNGHDATFGTRKDASSAPRSQRWLPHPLAWFATAALLVLAAGFGYVVFGPPRAEPEPPAIPAVLVQPATPEDANEQQFDMTLPEPILPAGTIYSWSTMYSIESGLSVEYPGFTIESPVAALVWVQSGTLALAGEHGEVHRGAAALLNASPAAGELLLGPDDAVALELGANHTYQLRSVGTEPLVFAEFWLIAGPGPGYIGKPELHILDYYHDSDAVTLAGSLHRNNAPDQNEAGGR